MTSNKKLRARGRRDKPGSGPNADRANKPKPVAKPSKYGIPNGHVMDLVYNFLKTYGYFQSCHHIRIETQKRETVEGYTKPASWTGISRKLPKLEEIFEEWQMDREVDGELPQSAIKSMDTSAGNGQAAVGAEAADSDSAGSGDESDDESGDGSGSESDASDSEEDDAPGAKGTFTPPPAPPATSDVDATAASTLKRKRSSSTSASSSYSEASSSSGSDGSSSSSAEELAEAPQAKKPKQSSQSASDAASSDSSSEESESSSASSGASDSDSDGGKSSSNEVPPAKRKETSKIIKPEPVDKAIEKAENPNAEHSSGSSDTSSSSDTSDASSDSGSEDPATTRPTTSASSSVDEQKSASESSATLAAASPVIQPSLAKANVSKAKRKLSSSPDANNPISQPGKFQKKTNTPFSRIKADQEVDARFASNAYVSYDYADRAYQDLSVTKGKGFTKEKNKKKRGSYRGGMIDIQGNKSIKFDD